MAAAMTTKTFVGAVLPKSQRVRLRAYWGDDQRRNPSAQAVKGQHRHVWSIGHGLGFEVLCLLVESVTDKI